MSNGRTRNSGARWKILVGVALLGVFAALHGCSDLGNDLPAAVGPPPGNAPSISQLLPPRTFPGDTVQVLGTHFGDTPGRVIFTAAALRSDVDGTIVSWADTKVVTLVPPTAGTGSVRVQSGDGTSTGVGFTKVAQISFANDVTPLFNYPTDPIRPGHDCVSCHGFCTGSGCTGGLGVIPYAQLMQGGDLGVVVIPRRSTSSLLIQRLLPSTSPDLRMPQPDPGTPPYMSAAEIQLIADWIDQGARNN